MPKAFSLSAKNGHSDDSSYLSSSLCLFTNGSIQWICCVDLNHSTRTFTFCVLFLGSFVLQKQLFWYKLERDVVHCSEKLGLANLLFLWHDPTWFVLDWTASFAIYQYQTFNMSVFLACGASCKQVYAITNLTKIQYNTHKKP